MKRIARIAGFFYLLVFVTGGISLAIGGQYVITGNAAATATNILTHETAFRFSWAINLVATACYVVVTALFYVLFRPASRSLALTAAFFSLMGCAVSAFASALQIAPLVILKSEALPPQQLQGMAYLFTRLSGNAGALSLAIFGVYCVLIGSLILVSRSVPRAIGVLMVIGGLSWLTFGWGPLSNALNPFNFVPGIVAEASLTLWLLIFGVREQTV